MRSESPPEYLCGLGSIRISQPARISRTLKSSAMIRALVASLLFLHIGFSVDDYAELFREAAG